MPRTFVFWELETYAFVIVYVGSNLVLHILHGGFLWGQLPIRSDEPVSWKLSFAVDMGNIEFRSAHFGKLQVMLENARGTAKYECYNRWLLTVTNENRSSSLRAAAPRKKRPSKTLSRNIMMTGKKAPSRIDLS